ncbi:AraC family transcriptional regulator [Cohnella silvisoli]|uniref:AraC family transcriptional regulator n=1 Tax=Cohnella silvisoli TaxID=2873699 RepID=A0ABV1KN80_9BACL|nr:AraC family transcriptional regulator [Cohnella silvisoli]MCD9020758.1 AraC family transcriptional regulator [Cohnella silvisoli]
MSDIFVNLNRSLFQLYFYGHEKCPPLHSAGPSVRDHYLFVYIDRGKGIFRGNGVTYELTGGDSFFMFPGHLGFYEADAKDPWEYRWVGFHGTHAERFLSGIGLSPDSPIQTHSDKNALIRLFDQLSNLEGDVEYKELFANGILLQVMAVLYNERARSSPSIAPASGTENRYIQKAIQFITQNYAEKISVPMIAAQVGLERSYFTKMFKKHAGKPPHVFLLEVRMHKAASLLKASDLPVEHIAYSTGFNNINHFSATFTRFYRMPPSKYRNQTN